MRRLRWGEAAGTSTAWFGAPGLWAGRFATTGARRGLYASTRGPMLSFMLDGALEVELGPRRQPFEIGAGAALFISPRTPFRYRLGEGARLLVLDLDVRAPRGLGLGPLPKSRVPPRLARAFARLRDHPREADLRAASSEARAVACAIVPLEPGHSTARLLEVKNQLDARFGEPVRVTALGAELGMGPEYLSRGFARAFGAAPQQYLQHIRTEHFLRSLLTGRGTLTQLAHEAGFGDYPSFCRFFRKRLGVAPSALREDQTCPSPRRRAG